MSSDSSVGIATGATGSSPCLIPFRGNRFLSPPQRSNRLWGPSQPPTQWVQESFSPGIKRSVCEADHSLPSSVELRMQKYLNALYHLHGVVLN
jgi:hypothetical protein